MKQSGLNREYHKSRKSAEDWKALWDNVKYDRKQGMFYLEVNRKRFDEYGAWLDAYISLLEKSKEKPLC
jgi:hypothetical protein